MIQPHEITVPIIGPPTPTRLDGVTFFALRPECETAWRAGVLIGDLEHHDEKDQWRARQCRDYGFDDWRSMRCRAEARAFIVSIRS